MAQNKSNSSAPTADHSTTCIAREVCPILRNSGCPANCLVHAALTQQLEMSGIRAEFHEIGGRPALLAAAVELMNASEPDVFQRLKSLGWGRGGANPTGYGTAAKINAGRGIYAMGKRGAGKSTLLRCLALEYIVHETFQAVVKEQRSPREQLVQWINVPRFLRLAKQVYEPDRIVAEDASRALKSLTRRMMAAKFLVLDDMGAGGASQSVVDRLLEIIDYRLDARLATAYTSNLTYQRLEVEFAQHDPDGRTVSRIKGGADAVAFVSGVDHRERGV